MLKGAFNITSRGFTLAELLIALLILGVIATFTIPKVIASSQNNMYSATGKEAAASISAAYQAAQSAGNITTSSGIKDLTPYLNYVQLDNSANTIDNGHNYPTATTSCTTSGARCLRLHSGGVIKYYQQDAFGDTQNTNGIAFFFDPDGQNNSATTNGPGKSIVFFLFYNGRLTDVTNGSGATYYNGSTMVTWATCANCKPSWFSW